MKRRTALVLTAVFLLLAGGLAACNLSGSDCEAEDLGPITNLAPAHDAVVDDLSVVLSWDYVGTCEPDSFEVTLFSSGLDLFPGATATVDGLAESWAPTTPLEPATAYRWNVRAVSGSTEGSVAWGNFQTGPVCEVGDPAWYPAPVLISPADGATVETTTTATFESGEQMTIPRFDLDWEGVAGCVVPGRYEVQVSRSPAFSPARNVLTDWTTWTEGWYFIAPGAPWHDCERLYWRVTPLMEDDTRGQTSDTWSFVLNTSGVFCPAELMTELEPFVELGPGIDVRLAGHGAIAGHVWHDECATPYATTDTAPPGCILMPDSSIEANGVLDPGESGIEGVTVLLDDGPCPGTDGWSYTTDASGHYGFYNLTAGTYCLEVNGGADGNEDILIPGHWTMPYRWSGPGPISVEVTLGSDDDISRLNDFGWDYQFLPSPGTPFARVLTDARCRLGPSFDYPILTYLSQGVSFPIIGRLEQGGWWQLHAAAIGKPCWIGEDVVEPYGDLTNVPFAIPPMLPTDEPTKEPPSPALGCWCRSPNQVCTYYDQCPAQCDVCQPK